MKIKMKKVTYKQIMSKLNGLRNMYSREFSGLSSKTTIDFVLTDVEVAMKKLCGFSPKYRLAWKSTGKQFGNLTFYSKKYALDCIKGHKSKRMDKALMVEKI